MLPEISPSELYSEIWDQKYSQNLKEEHPNMREPHHGLLEDKERHPYGEFQHFQTKNVGDYHVIKNSSYALKKGSPMIDKAENDKRITLPTSADSSSFKGWMTKGRKDLIVFVDLDKPCLIWPKKQDSQAWLTNTFLVIKTFQFCRGHSLLIVDGDINEPQILTRKHIKSLLIVSGLLPNYTFGYNSQGAASTLNYFHFQLFESKTLTNGGVFHFQTIKGELKSFSLKAEKMPEVKVNISVFEFIGAIFVRVSCKELPLWHPSVLEEITTIVFKVIQMAFDLVMPHNLNVPNPHDFYVILRNFATPSTRLGWIEYSGVYKTGSKQDFEAVDPKTIETFYNKLSLPAEDKRKILLALKKLFD